MSKTAVLLALVVVAAVVVALFAFGPRQESKPSLPDGATYNPQIDPANFVAAIDNKFLALTPGKKMVYEAKKGDGDIERIEVYVTSEKKIVMGIETTVVWDRVWLNNELIEDTKDWFAQDKDGNVWYFGEETYELEGGVVVNSEGAWEAGVDGAKPGIAMKADPQVGDLYRMEYYAGEAEDAGEVLALGETVTVPYGTLAGCLRTRDFSTLNPSANENKLYCPEVAGVALELDVEDDERAELVSVEYDAQPSPGTFSKAPAASAATTGASKPATPAAPAAPAAPKADITEAEARAIAIERVPGTVTDIAIEQKLGKRTYVVEVAASNGSEVDVIIDISTGEVLKVEE